MKKSKEEKIWIPKVGDKVRIKNFAEPFNGKVGRIKRIWGGYNYVRIRYARFDIEVYHCEMEKI